MINSNQFKITIAITLLCTVCFVNEVNASSTASVYSISSGNPVAYLNDYRVNTITKGVVNGKTIYKPMVQKIAKTLFVSTFRKIIAVNVVGLGLMLAYDYFIDNDVSSPTYGQIVTNETLIDGNSGSGLCTGYGSVSSQTLIGCATITQRNIYDFSGCTTVNVTCKIYLYDDDNNAVGYLSYTPQELVVSSENKNITDQQMLDSLDDYIANNENSNDLFLNPDGTPNQDFFPNPEFDYYTASDLELMDLYASGLLQSTDPLADNYVTPAEYQEIAEMYAQANLTDEELAEELTLDATEPMTYDEYKTEQLAKEARAVTASEHLNDVDLTNLDKTTELDEQFNILNTMLTNPADLPSILPVLPQFQPTSSCRTVSLPFDIVFPNASQCEKLNIAKAMIGYFLYVIFAWMITTELLKEAN